MNLLAYYIACPAFIALFVYVFDWSIYGVWGGLSLVTHSNNHCYTQLFTCKHGPKGCVDINGVSDCSQRMCD